MNFIKRHREVILYAILLAALLLLLKWLELRFIIMSHAFEVYAGVIALIFTALGIWLALKLTKPKVKTVVVEKEVYIKEGAGFLQNDEAISQLGLSSRELEVLYLMAGGLSNEEIGDKLHVSLNTIKTHSSRIFEKLEVKRRTQAVEKARRLSIIP